MVCRRSPHVCAVCRILQLDNNGLSGTLPESLGSMTSLTILDVTANEFSGDLPSAIGKLQFMTCVQLKLKLISFAVCVTCVFPRSDLFVGFNGFTGSIPDSYANLKSLEFV
jgi:hypothetical protein